MRTRSYPTVEKVLAASFYPNLQQILDESDRVTNEDLNTMDGNGLEWGYHIFNESLNPADTEPDMAMRGMGNQLNRMGG